MKTRLLFALLPLAFAACSHSPKEKDISVSAVRFPPPVVKADAEEKAYDKVAGNADGYSSTDDKNDSVQDTSKKVTRQGDLKFRTDDVAKTRKTILASLKATGGYLAEEKEFIDENDSTKNYTLDARIPAKNFDKFFSNVSVTAVQIDSKNITTTDVTTQYIDMSTRLRNKKALEARYLDLLHQSNRMADILEVENKLNDIRTDIESTQGQLNYLNKQIAYSSLAITFYTKRTDLASSGPTGNPFLDSMKDGWALLKSLFFGIIALWPVILIGIVLIAWFRRWRKKRKAARV